MVPEEAHVLVIGVVFQVAGEGGGVIGDGTRDYFQLLEIWAGRRRSGLFLYDEISDADGTETTTDLVAGGRLFHHVQAGNVKWQLDGKEGHTEGVFAGGGMTTWMIPSGSKCGQDAVGNRRIDDGF